MVSGPEVLTGLVLDPGSSVRSMTPASVSRCASFLRCLALLTDAPGAFDEAGEELCDVAAMSKTSSEALVVFLFRALLLPLPPMLYTLHAITFT